MERSNRILFVCVLIILILFLSGCDGQIDQCIDFDGIENEDELQNIKSIDDVKILKSKAKTLEESYFIVGVTGGLYQGQPLLLYDTCSADKDGNEQSSSKGDYVVEYYCESKLNVGQKVAKCNNGCYFRACLGDLECRKWVDEALNETNKEEDRVEFIRKIRYRNCVDDANQIILLISDPSSTDPITISSIVTLSHLGVSESYDEILNLFLQTKDELIFASASTGLFSLVLSEEECEKKRCGFLQRETAPISQEELLKIYADERKKMLGGRKYLSVSLSNLETAGPRYEFEYFIRLHVKKMDNIILNILNDPFSDYLIYAIQLAPIIYSYEHDKEQGIITLIDLLDVIKDDLYNQEILVALVGMHVSKEQATTIINKIPRKEIYGVEWDYLKSIINAKIIDSQTGNVPTEV